MPSLDQLQAFVAAADEGSFSAAGRSLRKAQSAVRSVLHSNLEFQAHAASISEGVETQLCIAVEQGIFVHSLTDILSELGQQFPFVEVEILDPGINDVPSLLKETRADIGMMMEQEDYPQGFHFRGVG